MLREFMYFFRSFIFTGILNVLPQMFLITHFPSYRAWLLPVYLMMYSASGVAGLWWSRRFVRSTSSTLSSMVGRGPVFLATFLMNGTLFILFEIRTWQGFLGCLVVLAFLVESSFNVADNALVEQLSEKELSRHSARASIAQLLGVCLAPMSFTLGYTSIHATWIVGVICALFAGISYLSLSSSILAHRSFWTPANLPQSRATDESRDEVPGRRSFRLPPIDRVYLLYVLSMYCAAFLFTSYGIFMVRDFYRISAASYGVWMITVLNSSSIVGALAYGAMMRRRRNQNTFLQGGVLAAGLLIVAIILFAMRLNFHLYFILVLAFLAGFPYGCFLVMSRENASRRTSITGNHLLSFYNVSADVASVTAFLISLVVTLCIGEGHATGYIAAPIVIIVAFLALALTASSGMPLLKKRSTTPAGREYQNEASHPKGSE